LCSLCVVLLLISCTFEKLFVAFTLRKYVCFKKVENL
jgi:hypothetical protein